MPSNFLYNDSLQLVKVFKGCTRPEAIMKYLHMVMINTKRIKEVSLLQQDSTDCGAACLASVIRYFGGNSGIDKIRRLSGTTQSGTTMLGLYQAAQEFGMEATGYEASVNDIMKFTGILIFTLTPQKGMNIMSFRMAFQMRNSLYGTPQKVF